LSRAIAIAVCQAELGVGPSGVIMVSPYLDARTGVEDLAHPLDDQSAVYGGGDL